MRYSHGVRTSTGKRVLPGWSYRSIWMRTKALNDSTTQFTGIVGSTNSSASFNHNDYGTAFNLRIRDYDSTALRLIDSITFVMRKPETMITVSY